MSKADIESTVFPRGKEGLRPEVGWKEGEPLVSPEGQAALHREVGRSEALDMAERVARAEGTKAAEAVVNREKESKAGQLKAFKSFLWSLEELAGKDAGAMADPAETRLIFRLYRLEDSNGGVKPAAIYQTAVSFGASEALALGDPDFEGRAQAWAERSGRFGRYQWRILGWAAGEQTLDTTYNLNTEAPAGYEPPKAAAPELIQEPPKDPLSNLKEGLTLINLVKETLGGQASGGKVDQALLETLRSSAQMQARAETMFEADRNMRERIAQLDDRWEIRMEAAKTEAYNRGIQDGRRAAEDEWRPKVWDLERKLDQGREPSLIEEAVRAVGGPDVVQAIARTVMSNPPAPKPAPVARPVMPLQPKVNQSQAAPAQATQAAAQEPTRMEWKEALEDAEDALEILAEHDDGSQQTQQLREVLKAFLEQGQVEGNLGAWWQAWTQFIRQAVQDVLKAAEEPSLEGRGEEGMDLEDMKTLLITRLDEGAADEEILQELQQVTTPEQRAEWRKMLGWIPQGAVVQMIGGGKDPERIQRLLSAFMAGN